jgi:hypothetical protein
MFASKQASKQSRLGSLFLAVRMQCDAAINLDTSHGHQPSICSHVH